jgi:hypothetical protein
MKTGSNREAFKSFIDITGQALYSNEIKLWAWQPYRAVEIHKAPMVKSGDFSVEPADPWTVEHYIKSQVTGLAHRNFYPWLLQEESPAFKKASDYPWLAGFSTEKKVTVADNMIARIRNSWKKGEIPCTDPNDIYYLFITMDIDRAGSRLPVGELEDITFDMRMHVISHNALLIKMVELDCREKEIDRYIEEMLGVKKDDKSIEELVKKEFPELFKVEKPKEPTQFELFKKEWSDTISGLMAPFKSANKHITKSRPWLVKTGPYETDWDERITKHYLIPSGQVFGTVTGYLMSKMGIE